MSNFKSYIKGVGSGYLNMLIINIVGLLLTPFVLKYLTKEEFALFYIAGDLLMWLGLAQLGVSSSYNSRAAQLFGQKNEQELRYLTSSAWGLQIASSILIIIAGIVLSFFVNSFFDVKDNTHQTQIFFLILVIASAAQVMSQVFSALLVSAKLINISNRISIASVIPKVLFTILFLLAGWKLVGLALANMIASITPIIISIFYVRKKFPQIPIRLKYWTRKHSGELLMNGIWFTIGGVAGILISGLDRIVIAKVVSLEIVASFLITQKLYFLADKVLGQLFNVTRPYMGQLYGGGSFIKLNSLYRLFVSLSILIAVVGASTIMIFNDLFVNVWVGNELFSGQTVNIFLAINFMIQFIVLPHRVLLATTMFHLRDQAVSRLVEGLFNFGLSIILGKQYGIPGVIIGSIVPSLIFSNIVYSRLSWQFFKSHNVINPYKSVIKYILLGLPIIIGLILLKFNILYVKLFVFLALLAISYWYLKCIIYQFAQDGVLASLSNNRAISNLLRIF